MFKLNNSYKFTDRQIFEILYSSLCSLRYNNFFLSDAHLKNVLVFNDSVKTIIEIDNKFFYFNSYESIVFIDYAVVKKYTIEDLYNYIKGSFSKFIKIDFLNKIEIFFNEMKFNYDPWCYNECIINLYKLFDQFIINDIREINISSTRVLKYI